MALFKILKGNKNGLPSNKVDGYCYVTLDEHKMYIDYEKSDKTLGRFVLNAYEADFAKGSIYTDFTNMSPWDFSFPEENTVLYGYINTSINGTNIDAPCETYYTVSGSVSTIYQIIKVPKFTYITSDRYTMYNYTEYYRCAGDEGSWTSWELHDPPFSATGDATTPVYINSSGVPVACRYQLNETVPKDAVFTDTTYGVATSSTLGLIKSGNDITIDTEGNVTVDKINTILMSVDGSATDVNTLKEAKKFRFYNLSSNGTYTNLPAGVQNSNIRSGIMSYPLSGSSQVQEAIFNNNKKYYRYSNGESWYDWRLVCSMTPNTAIGSSTKPIYMTADGVPLACSYSLNKTVPSNAVFTDTTYTAGTGLTLSGTTFNHSNSVTAKTTNNQSTVTLKSGESFKVTEPLYDAQGHITGTNVATVTLPTIISSAATQSAAGLMSATDKKKLDSVTDNADAVSFTQSLTSGTQVGTITINGTATKLYAPTNTDTHYTTGLKVANSATATANAASTNGNVYINLFEEVGNTNTIRDSHLIKGTGATTVTSDANGVITIKSTDTTYSGDRGISLSSGKFGHSNKAITAGSVGAAQTPSFGGTFAIPKITYDAYGHITAATTVNVTLPNAATDDFLPLTAGENKKLTGPLGLTSGVMYGATLPTSGFNGQLFFLEDNGATLPTGGSAGQALVKNTATDGDASWKSSSISWAAGTSNGPQPKIFGVTGSAIPAASDSASGIVTTGAQTFAGEKTFSSGIAFSDNTGIKGYMAGGSDWWLLKGSGSDDSGVLELVIADNASTDYFDIIFRDWDTAVGDFRAIRFGKDRIDSYTKFYGAVWNDYAEFRTQKEIIEPGYCVASTNNGQVYKTTKKFQACDGIVSDTFGFAIGETDECKTPLAVAGRVLAYFHGNRENYHSGDTVCAGPEGKVMKMTREEIKEYPDRIIGIVSEIPEYETWGSDNVAVNGRIWIKVR